ncbi:MULTISPECIES: ATP-binding protein [unclassified Arcicella]|uniref:ATP-binding protein n=1 Tax=unclassified Arcicella TaxID=2644986 RepID=UPI00285C042C|nr:MULTISPECIES: ATP-binding protein [unclassified Arcicella]MDR6563039.1 putative kinase [Arcicella sp. BE51]MDR6813123.1 putative kinase [Arcicella sp. BE140]MDR6824437.1 putative kinase [Arcicella sp. BE139]
METVIFCGIQATGKTTFFKENFFKTHIRISLDLLKTRNKEQKFIDTCLATQQRYVVDNTNPTKVDRAKYISDAKANKFKVVGYYFQSKINDALNRNSQRLGKENIPEVGIKGTFNKLEIPTFDEGFDELYFVEIDDNNFKIKEWENEI